MNVSSAGNVSSAVNSTPVMVRASNSETRVSACFWNCERIGSRSPFMHRSPSGASKRSTPPPLSAGASSTRKFSSCCVYATCLTE
jgi:hypothetical protein